MPAHSVLGPLYMLHMLTTLLTITVGRRLMKTGFLQKRHERAIVRASAAAELLGYAASVSLGLARLRVLDAQAAVLRARAAAAAAAGAPEPGLARQLELMSSARLLRLALIAQDLADSCNAINDLSGADLKGGGGGAMLITIPCFFFTTSSTSTFPDPPPPPHSQRTYPHLLLPTLCMCMCSHPSQMVGWLVSTNLCCSHVRDCCLLQ